MVDLVTLQIARDFVAIFGVMAGFSMRALFRSGFYIQLDNTTM
jgi:hypothetical protein